MNMRLLNCLWICLIGLLIYSCNKYDSPVNAVPGTISGFVNVFDEDGNSASQLGVVVSLDGRNISTTTDSVGRFKLRDVPAGVYTISYSKTGFGTFRTVSYNFAGNGDAYINAVAIAAIPSISSFLNSVSIDSSSGVSSVYIEGTISKSLPASTDRNVLLYFGTAESVSSEPSSYKSVSTAFVSSLSNHFALNISLQSLHALGFKSGQRVYVTSYATSKQYYRYIDVSTSRFRYSGISDKRQNSKDFELP